MKTTTDLRPMHNPPHPGYILKTLYLDGAGLTITDAAAGMQVSRKALSQLINGRVSVSPDMALRLADAFPPGSAALWLNLQQQFDIWQASQQPRPAIAPLWQPPTQRRIKAA